MLKLVEGWVLTLVDKSIRHARVVLLIYILLALLSIAVAVLFLRVDTDSSKMLSSNLDFQQRTHVLNRDFPAIKNSIVIIVRSPLPDAADAASQHLVDVLQESEYVSKVFAPSVDPFFQANGLLYQSQEELETSLNQLNKSASMLANLRENQTLSGFWHALLTAETLATESETDIEFLDDFYGDVSKVVAATLQGETAPLSWAKASGEGSGSEASDGITQRLVYVEPKLDFSRLQPAKPALQDVSSATLALDDDLQKLVEIGVTGDPVLRFEELQSVQSGIGYSLALSFLFVTLLLFFAFGHPKRVLLILSALIFALILSAGFAAFFVAPLNLVSVAFVVLLVGLGLDFSIHATAHLDDMHARPVNERLRSMATGIGGALFLSFLTTALAFLSFMPTEFVGIAQLGALGAAGVAIAFLVSVTYVPALISLFPGFAGASQNKDRRVIRFPLEKFVWLQKPLALLLLMAFLVLAYLAKDVRFDADPITLRDPESPSMQALNLLSEKPETVPYRVSLLRASEDEAVEAAEAVTQLESVHSATTLSDLVPEDQDEKFFLIDVSYTTLETISSGEGLEPVEIVDGKTPFKALSERLQTITGRPAVDDLRTQLDLLTKEDQAVHKKVERAIFRFFPQLISTINSQLAVDTVTLEKLPAPLRARYIGEGGKWRVDVVPEGDTSDPAFLEAFVADIEAFDAEASGPPVQIINAGETVARAITIALGLGTVAILTIAFVVLGSFTRLIAIFVPLLIAGVMTAGASVLFDIPFNYANVIVLPLLIGLGVDSGIHIASRRAQSADMFSFFQTSTPKAVLFSGLTTIAAFATLGVSDHKGTASMGQMLAIAIFVTLACTIILTPLLIDFFEKRSSPE